MNKIRTMCKIFFFQCTELLIRSVPYLYTNKLLRKSRVSSQRQFSIDVAFKQPTHTDHLIRCILFISLYCRFIAPVYLLALSLKSCCITARQVCKQSVEESKKKPIITHNLSFFDSFSPRQFFPSLLCKLSIFGKYRNHVLIIELLSFFQPKFSSRCHFSLFPLDGSVQ